MLRKSLELAFSETDELTVWQWAERYRRLGKDVTALPGAYRVSNTPYQREPQESFTDRDVQSTVLWWGSRLGKTETLNNLEGYVAEHDPSSVLVVYPTLDSAKKWSKEFFTPMVNATPKLRGRIREAKSRDSNNTILSKHFPGGKISAIGANSPSGFRQIQARVVICDEIDAMENGAEGDPVTLAFKRADNYSDSIQVLSSTSTIKGFSRIEKAYLQSDQRKWFVACPKCGADQLLVFSQVHWPGREIFEINPQAHADACDPEKAHYNCSHCQTELSDTDRVAMVKAGKWRATAPFRGVRGYWLNGLNTTFPAKKGFKTKLHQMAQEYMTARLEGDESMQVWTNTFLTESYEPADSTIPLDPLYKRREEYTHELLPPKIVLLVAGVDVQSDRIEMEVSGFGDGEEWWGVEFVRILGNPSTPEPWRVLSEALCKLYTHPLYGPMRVKIAFVDSGYLQASVFRIVRNWEQRRIQEPGHREDPLMFAVKGVSGECPIAPRLHSRSNAARAAVCRVGVDMAKDELHARIKLVFPGPKYLHFPMAYELEWFQQLLAEKPYYELRKGKVVKVWKKANKQDRNEALDIRVYSLAAFIYYRRLPESIKGSLDKALAAKQLAKSVEQPETVISKTNDETFSRPAVNRFARTAGGGGFVKGWRKYRWLPQSQALNRQLHQPGTRSHG